MQERFLRTALVLGEDNVEKLSRCRVALFGLGGVGGYVAEALARCGVGSLHLTDGDALSVTNINRQIYALSSTVGRSKCDVAAERIKDINPQVEVTVNNSYFNSDNADYTDFTRFDYVADAIDDVRAKVLLAVKCRDAGVPLVSCMGTGNKLNPMGFKVADIYSTSVCPLARVMRRELKRAGIRSLKVVYSVEEPTRTPCDGGAACPGSVSFVPPAAGLLMASEIIRDLISR